MEWEPHSIDILLTDPPYGVLNIERDSFSSKEIADFAALAKKVMKSNGYACDLISIVLLRSSFLHIGVYRVGMIYCSVQQFEPWYEALTKEGFTCGKVPW